MPDHTDRGLDSAADTALAPAPSHAPVDAARFTPGKLLAGRYRIIAPLGKGGMGEVYRADDIRLGQPVALKFLPAALASDSERLERLVDEVRIGRQISHPNVCRLYDIAEGEGHHFLVMEYVDGEDLASLLRRIGRLPGDKALEIARGLCAGLAAAHDKGVIHRDLKPANVMIDGRGHARIADFGLAALAISVAGADRSGTPSYMAPEQLSGEGASLRSDVFALGLVLREMLTGERMFEGKSLDAIRALHAQSKPLGISSSVKEVDPDMERLVLKCLSRDPRDRPASARAVLASLPGGDPLQAAVLAGETPSPEMVAAAAKVGDLTTRAAWTCLITALLGLLAITMMNGRALFRQAPLPKPPEALVDRARDVLARLGYPRPGADSAHGFMLDSRFIEDVRKRGSREAQAEILRRTRPGPYLFYYRESPRPLLSNSWSPAAPWEGPARIGRVLVNEPALLDPGMTRIVLDSRGRLVRFDAVPPAYRAEGAPAPEPDWPAVLTEAGFEPVSLRPGVSRWSLAVDADRRAAWDGPLAGQPDVPFHIEAAAWHGALVSFTMRGPWVQPPPAIDSGPSQVSVALVMMVALSLAVVAAAIVLARRNLRLGRGDRRGAWRLAVFAFASLIMANLFQADHTALPVNEYNLLVQIVSQGIYWALLVWLCYMALEPAVRRRWPETLISWNRLLAGRFRDPLLGRDILAGATSGMATALVFQYSDSIPPGLTLSTLTSPRYVAYYFCLAPSLGVAWAVTQLFLLYLLQSLTRRTWLARLLLFLCGLVTLLLAFGATSASIAPSAALAISVVAVLIRYGLVSFAMMWFTLQMLLRTPLTHDLSAWYAGPSFAVLGFFVVLLGFAFYNSLGGKPLFGKPLLED